MTSFILVLYCWRFHKSPSKSWPRKFTSSNLVAICNFTNFSKCLLHEKKQDLAMAEGKRASPKRDVPVLFGGGRFSACRLPGGSSTCSYGVLLASVVCNCCQKLPRRECWDKSCQGTRKARSVAVGLTNARMFTVPVGTLISLSHSQEPHVKRKSFAFRYCGRDGTLKLRWHP